MKDNLLTETVLIVGFSTVLSHLCEQTQESVQCIVSHVCRYLKAKDILLLIHNSHVPLTEQEERELQSIANTNTYIDMQE